MPLVVFSVILLVRAHKKIPFLINLEAGAGPFSPAFSPAPFTQLIIFLIESACCLLVGLFLIAPHSS